MNDFRPAILRELNRQCATDILGRHLRPFYDSTRITWSRLNAIVSMAETSGSLPNARQLAIQFGICTKTIQRDIAHLRKSGRLHVTYNDAQFNYSAVLPSTLNSQPSTR